MDRKDRVEQELIRLTQNIVPNCLNAEARFGFSTTYVAENLGLLRTNVSKELNCLLKEEKVLKISGKPVLYLAVKPLKNFYGNFFQKVNYNNFLELKQDLSRRVPSNARQDIALKMKRMPENGNKVLIHTSESDIFNRLIGGEDDLQVQIKQAKAAILYPPHGLHTLIIGPTGCGKTTFAGMMYRYAIETGTLSKEAAYVIFNCADYAENTQLLISHLFGHVKGAYTGAEKEKKGLIDQANGGILFLDEIHRLPPEGQEMLFSLIDRGIYRRLGEADCVRTANVLIIGATTEDPKSAVLGTFLRRIPLVIHLPGLDERTLKGRMKLVCQFFKEESVKIKAPLLVDKEVLKVLLLYRCPGNIGQLRNDIQLICANAFVEYVQNINGSLRIKLSQLSQKIKEGFFRLNEKRQELIREFNLNGYDMITFDGTVEHGSDTVHDLLMYDEYQTSENFYDILLAQVQNLYNQGMEIPEIKAHIKEQFEKKMDKGLPAIKSKLALSQEILAKIATPEIVEAIKKELKNTQDILNMPLNPKILYGLALHIETMVERLRQGEVRIYPNLAKVRREHPVEYGVAVKIKESVEKCLDIHVAEDESAFIAMFIYSMELKKEAKVQVLVMSHGQSTASNMVGVAKTLLDCDCLHALDMPMEEKVVNTLNKAVEIVRKINKGSGVMLLVDMGSLVEFAEIITKQTGVPIKCIPMVSTPMVIEAARKAMFPDITLDEIEKSVLTMSSFIGGRVRVDDEKTSAVKKHVKMVRMNNFQYSDQVIAMLEDILTFLNVKKVCGVLDQILNRIAAKQNKQVDDIIHLKFLFHCACMIERSIRKEPLPYNNFAQIVQAHPALFSLVQTEFELVEEVFGIKIEETELAYIVEMLNMLF